MKEVVTKTKRTWHFALIIFLFLEVVNYGVLSIFITIKICSFISTFVTVLLLTYAHKENKYLTEKVEKIYSSLYDVEKEVRKLSNDVEKLVHENSKMADEIIYVKSDIKQMSNTVNIANGYCSVTGDDDIFEICIVTDGKQYKFNAHQDQIVEYMKNGNWERYGC